MQRTSLQKQQKATENATEKCKIIQEWRGSLRARLVNSMQKPPWSRVLTGCRCINSVCMYITQIDVCVSIPSVSTPDASHRCTSGVWPYWPYYRHVVWKREVEGSEGAATVVKCLGAV